jgi:hypothetical protein
VFSSCEETGEENEENEVIEIGEAYLGEELKLSGQVYIGVTNRINYSVSYTAFSGDLKILNYNGENGEITGGELDCTIGTPTHLNNIVYFFDEKDGYAVSNKSVKCYILYEIKIPEPSKYDIIKKQNLSVNTSNNFQTLQIVEYVYVDSDVIVSAKGGTETVSGVTYTMQDTVLAFKKGWNAVYSKLEGRLQNQRGTLTRSLGNPDLKWVLYE